MYSRVTSIYLDTYNKALIVNTGMGLKVLFITRLDRPAFFHIYQLHDSRKELLSALIVNLFSLNSFVA